MTEGAGVAMAVVGTVAAMVTGTVEGVGGTAGGTGPPPGATTGVPSWWPVAICMPKAVHVAAQEPEESEGAPGCMLNGEITGQYARPPPRGRRRC